MVFLYKKKINLLIKETMSGFHLGKLLMFTSVGSTAVAEFFMGGKGHIKRIIDREPVVAFSILLGSIGFAAPQIIPPIRRSMGYDTSQYYGRPSPAPVSTAEVGLLFRLSILTTCRRL